MATARLRQRPPGWGQEVSPFHAGEQAVQARVGMRERMEQVGRRLVRDFMPDEHREFFEDLPFVIVGSADAAGAAWASLLPGEPGFISAPTPRSLLLHAEVLPGDPLADNWRVGAPLGLLGIELVTRRRNRANGHVVSVAGGVVQLAIEQSFGNCMQYIQSRAGAFAPPQARALPSLEGAVLSTEARALLARADTSFIATSSREPQIGGGVEGLDVSHRGGRPGFIRSEQIGGATWLTLPDFSGNFMFNTFGNLEVNPSAGFLVLDFARGSVLSLTGAASVNWDEEAAAAFEGAERLLEFRVQSGWLWHDILSGWSEAEQSPHLRDTGTWPEGAAK